MVIKHATLAPGSDSGDGKISHNAWDEAHTGGFENPMQVAGDLIVGGGTPSNRALSTLGASITATGSWGWSNPSYMIDANDGTYAAQGNGSSGTVITISLNASYVVSTIRVLGLAYDGHNTMPASYQVKYSANGTDWTYLLTHTTYQTVNDIFSITPIDARYWRIDTPVGAGEWQWRIYTIELIGAGANESGAPARLTIGSTGEVLTVVGGIPSWKPIWRTQSGSLVVTALLRGGRTGSFSINAMISRGHFTVDAFVSYTNVQVVPIVAVFDGHGSEIADSVQIDVEVPFACTLTAWRILADVAGAIVIDVWKNSYANFPPTNADAMPGSGKEPTITATNAKAEDTSITDWTSYTIAAGNILRFNVDSCTTITRATLTLTATKS